MAIQQQIFGKIGDLLQELSAQYQRLSDSKLNEQGAETAIFEATARYLADEIRRADRRIKVTRIATGVPAGSDIEYADEITMSRALEGRREL